MTPPPPGREVRIDHGFGAGAPDPTDPGTATAASTTMSPCSRRLWGVARRGNLSRERESRADATLSGGESRIRVTDWVDAHPDDPARPSPRPPPDPRPHLRGTGDPTMRLGRDRSDPGDADSRWTGHDRALARGDRSRSRPGVQAPIAPSTRAPALLGLDDDRDGFAPADPPARRARPAACRASGSAGPGPSSRR